MIVVPIISFDIIKDDPDNNRVLECALEGQADCIISGDNPLLSLGTFKGIKIISAADFLKIFL